MLTRACGDGRLLWASVMVPGSRPAFPSLPQWNREPSLTLNLFLHNPGLCVVSRLLGPLSALARSLPLSRRASALYRQIQPQRSLPLSRSSPRPITHGNRGHSQTNGDPSPLITPTGISSYMTWSCLFHCTAFPISKPTEFPLKHSSWYFKAHCFIPDEFSPRGPLSQLLVSLHPLNRLCVLLCL